MRKPLILNGLKGFFASWLSLVPWFGTPSGVQLDRLNLKNKIRLPFRWQEPRPPQP
jgi:hypothetical protein